MKDGHAHGCVTYPRITSEFEVQAELYCRLKTMKLYVRGCVPSRCVDHGKSHKVFFDLVVFDEDRKAVVIIECKNWKKERKSLTGESRQARRYNQFGVPVILCANIAAVESVIQKVLNIALYPRD